MKHFRGPAICGATPLVTLLLFTLHPLAVYSDSFLHSDVAVQLSQSNFSNVLNSLALDRVCLFEFYASWCPACKQFAPTFEKLAFFLKDKSLGGQYLFIARVDCASEAKLCGELDVRGFPTLSLGLASVYATKLQSKLTHFQGHERNLPHLVAWVGEYFKTELNYTEPTTITDSHTASSASVGPIKRRPLPANPEWSLVDVEGATLQLWSIIASTPHLHRGAEKRTALRGVLEGWAAAHPSPSCKLYSARLLSSYDTLWPSSVEQAPEQLLHSEPCGQPAGLAFKGEWVTCRGSKPDTRGYSCGLWEMIHTMALRFPDKPGAAGPAQAMMTFLNVFNTHFFLCEPCQKHFGRILTSPNAAAVTDRRALVLWLWKVHNEVNERLRDIEARYSHSTTGDAEFPKEQWPAPESCPLCRESNSSGAWVEDRVLEHLENVFGIGSVPGADGVKGGQNLQLGLVSRIRTSSFMFSLLPMLGILAVAMLLFIFLRSTLVSGRRGRGQGGGMWSTVK